MQNSGTQMIGEQALGSAPARVWLKSLDGELAFADPERLLAALDRAHEVYQEFPELELECPRREVLEDLQSAARKLGDERGRALLMFCVALDTAASAPLRCLLEELVREERWAAVAKLLTALPADREFTWDEVAPVLQLLARRDLSNEMATCLSGLFERLRLRPGGESLQLGDLLKTILVQNPDDPELDPSVLAGLATSARQRMRRSTPRPVITGPTDGLMRLTERVVERIGLDGLVPPSPERPRRQAWASGHLTFAEFAEQWSQSKLVNDDRIEKRQRNLPRLTPLKLDLLPLMTAGPCAEREGGILRAKPKTAGHIVFGPYMPLLEGRYGAKVQLEILWPARAFPKVRRLLAIEVMDGSKFLARHRVDTGKVELREHFVPFVVDRDCIEKLEIRVWTAGKAPVTVSSISVEKLEPIGARRG